MKLITLDFETYYDAKYSLTSLTTEEYIRDPRFEVIGVAYQIDDGEPVWVENDGLNNVGMVLSELDIPNSVVVCHNAWFDGAILAWHYGLCPAQWLDTWSMARPHHMLTNGGSLAALATLYGVGVKGTEVIKAKGKHWYDFTPDERYEYGEYCKNDVRLTYALCKILLDKTPESELPVIDTTIRMFTEPVLKVDVPLLEQHLEEIKSGKYDLLAACGISEAQLQSSEQLAQALLGRGVHPPMKRSPKTGKLTYDFAKTSPAFKALLDHADTEVVAIVAARLGVKSTLEATRTKRFIDIGQRGAMPIMLKYYAAHTGRFGGGDKVNLQNLPRKSALREALLAPPGHVLIAGDSAQIEARVLAYLAGQTDVVEAFASGRDVYAEMASKLYGFPVNKRDHPTERFVGKVYILGGGYGAGEEKMGVMLAQAGVVVSDVQNHEFHQNYRASIPYIKKLWYRCQEIMARMSCAEWYHEQLDERGIIVWGRNKLLLPNGLALLYPGLHECEDFEWRYTASPRGGESKLYGGKMTENIVQALARIIVTDQMTTIAERYKVVFSVHDEIVCCVREEEAEEAKIFIDSAMRVAPAYMPGLPLSCEVNIGENYGQCK